MLSFIVFVLTVSLFGGGYYWYFSAKKKEDENRRWMEEKKREEERLLKEQNEEEERKRLEKEIIAQHKRHMEFLNKKRNEFKESVDAIPEFEITLSGEKHNRNTTIYIEPKNVTKSTSLNKIKDFIAVDVETTGLKVSGNDIIQLSAVKYNNFVAVEKFNTFLKPRKAIPKEATEINGITDDMVKDAPFFYQIINSFNEFIADYPLVAHNAPFDMKHLYVNGLDSIEGKTVYDTLELSRRLLKGEDSYKLADICETINIYIYDAHNSIYDSYAAGELFKFLVAERREISVEELLGLLE